MACSPTPTATLYTSIASTSTSSTFSESVTTILPVLTTVSTQVCATPSPDSTATDGSGGDDCIPVEIPVVSTVNAGGITTIQVPVQVIYEFTQFSPTATLFGPCSSVQPAAGGVPPTSSSTPVSESGTTSTTIVTPTLPPLSTVSGASNAHVFTTVVTPAPSVVVASLSSTRSDGSVVLVLTTMTSTFPPTSIVLPDTTSSASAGPGHTSGSSLIAPVVGGILGGFFGLIGIVVLLWILWRRRRMYSRASTPEPPMAYRSDLVRPDGTMARRPYVYGAVGSVNSQGSRPGTPRERESSVYSQGGTPRSAGGRSSTLTHSGAPTPTFFAGTAIQPGHSQPSSRPSTPGHFFPQSQSAPPSAFRQSWPRYAGDEEVEVGGAPVGFTRERRPSRLSLTLSMMEGSRETEETQDKPGSMSRRSPTASLGGGAGGDVVRSSSMSTEVHVPEPSRSTLFVVNCGNEESKHSGDPPPPGQL